MIRQEKERYLAETSKNVVDDDQGNREFAIINCEWSVAEAIKARREAKKHGISMQKIPNRLLVIILKKLGITLPKKLGGQNMLLHCNESFNISNVICKFEEHKIKQQPLYLFNAEECIDFTQGKKIETHQQTLGMILGAIQSPMANLISILDQLVEQELI